jgi:sulfur carrier protein
MSASVPITIRLDGEPRMVPLGASLAAVVAELGHAPNAVGTAVNGLFVARHLRDERVLAEGDAVLLFQPIVGG